MTGEVRDAARRLRTAGFSVPQISQTIGLPAFDIERVVA